MKPILKRSGDALSALSLLVSKGTSTFVLLLSHTTFIYPQFKTHDIKLTNKSSITCLTSITAALTVAFILSSVLYSLVKRNWNHFSIITGINSSPYAVPPWVFHSSVFTLSSNYLLDSHHRQVDVGSIQLQVDLHVDCSLALRVEVLSHLGTHGSETQQKKKNPY